MWMDLHNHSQFSDGQLTPTELIREAQRTGLGVMGLTDHDTVAGLPEFTAAGAAAGIRTVPGVEISTKISNQYVKKASVHILGYFIDYENRKLIDTLADLRNVRIVRFQKMKEKLENLGYKVELTPEDLQKESLGRPHLANALVRSGYFKTVQEVFNALLAMDKPAYVSLGTISQAETIQLIHQAGGLAFLAHPCEINSKETAEELLSTLPFDGVEVYHPSVKTPEDQAWVLNLAEKFRLKRSGGSDFHGTKGRFPEQIGIFKVQDTQTDKIFSEI